MTKEKNKVRILSVLDYSGSSFHRCFIPLNALSGQTIKVEGEDCEIQFSYRRMSPIEKAFTEEDFRDYDIVWWNWLVRNDTNQLAAWGKKYNTLIVSDYDDYYEYPEDHINRSNPFLEQQYKMLKPTILSGVCNSDMVLVTNDPLLEMVKDSSFAGISENFLPLNMAQFTPKNKVVKSIYKKKDKIALGIFGSESHVNDWSSLKGIWNKISSDSYIRRHCKLVIAGYVASPFWNKVIGIFSKNNFEIEILEAQGVDNYMELLDRIDILLAPLEDNDFNRAKSNIKLLEASIKGIPVLSGTLYKEKAPINNYIVCDKLGDYYENIKFLISKNLDGLYNYEVVGKELSDKNLAENKFDYRMDKVKAGLEYILNNPYKMDENLNIYGITYDNQFTEYTRVDNSGHNTLDTQSYLFEWNFLASDKFVENMEDDKFYGAFSWKFQQKTGFSHKVVDRMFRENKEYDIIGFTKQHWESGKEFMNFSEEHHPGLTNLLKEVLDNTGKPYYEDFEFIVYSNFFLMRGKSWKDFIYNWVRPAIKYMEKSENRDKFLQDANYKSGLSSEEIEKFTGLPYYSFHTFILERIINQYVASKNLNFRSVYKPKVKKELIHE